MPRINKYTSVISKIWSKIMKWKRRQNLIKLFYILYRACADNILLIPKTRKLFHISPTECIRNVDNAICLKFWKNKSL
jgi:hypothetical protein